jgi:ankyrin repeat protein
VWSKPNELSQVNIHHLNSRTGQIWRFSSGSAEVVCPPAMADNSSGNSDGRDKEEERARVSETSQVLWHARQNNVGALEKLLKQNPCLVNANDYDERTALHVAAFHGCTEAAKCLLDHGASVNAVDRWENSVSYSYHCNSV